MIKRKYDKNFFPQGNTYELTYPIQVNNNIRMVEREAQFDNGKLSWSKGIIRGVKK